MGDEDHGVALFVQFLKHPQHLPAGMGVQRACRFVGQNDGRVADKGAGDGHTLLLAAGELVGLVPELAAQTHLFQRCDGAAAALAAAHACVDEGDFHVFQQGQLGQQIILLEDEAQLLVPDGRQLTAVHLADVAAVQQIPAVGGHIQTADDVHAGGFAGAGLAHDGHELAFFDFHGDVVCSLYRGVTHLVILAHLIKLDQSAHAFLLCQPR